jgi:CP family cyanate transporter-like MFS transporter
LPRALALGVASSDHDIGAPGLQRKAQAATGAGPLPLLFLITFWIGFNLRAAILGVPPVLALLRSDLHLSFTEVGLLSSLPILTFAVSAIPAAGLVRRWGGYAVVGAGLAAAAVGELFRAVPGGALPLFIGTLVMGAGIAITQPGLPALFQRWFAGRVQTGSVTLTLGITVGEMVSASISRTVLFGWLHSWQATMVFWGVSGLSCAVVWLFGVPRARVGLSAGSSWELGPLFRAHQLWPVYICFGGQSLVFFAANTWIPNSVVGGPHSNLASLSLAVLNGVMIPVDVGLLLVRRPFASRRWFYVVSGIVTVVGTAGWFFYSRDQPLLFAALIGAGVAMNFAGLFAFPAMVADPARVAPLTAVMLTTGYACAFCGPLLGGIAIDLGGGERSPFVPIVAASLIMVVASARIPAHLPRNLRPVRVGPPSKVEP